MAGTDPRFNAKQFREAISFAMTMGLPDNPAQRATFHYTTSRTYPPGTKLDREGRPLDPHISPVKVTPDPVQIPVAIDFKTATYDELPVGAHIPAKVVITVIDEEWAKVRDAHTDTYPDAKPIEVELDGDMYRIGFLGPPQGLFEVTIYELYCFAKEES